MSHHDQDSKVIFVIITVIIIIQFQIIDYTVLYT